jgi:hypothetical protein
VGYKAVILGFYIFCFSMSYAQKHQFKLGLGNYEGLNIGLRHSFSKFEIEYGLGTDFNVFKQGYNNNVHALIGKRLFKKSDQPKNYYFVQFKSVFWHLENPSNRFINLSLSPEFLFKRNLNTKIDIGVYGGFVWTTNLKYVRKTYQEIGFPREFQPGFGVQLFYKLK